MPPRAPRTSPTALSDARTGSDRAVKMERLLRWELPAVFFGRLHTNTAAELSSPLTVPCRGVISAIIWFLWFAGAGRFISAKQELNEWGCVSAGRRCLIKAASHKQCHPLRPSGCHDCWKCFRYAWFLSPSPRLVKKTPKSTLVQGAEFSFLLCCFRQILWIKFYHLFGF